MRLPSILRRFAEEVGLYTMASLPRDALVMCLARTVRMFAYGSSTLVLVLLLTGLGNRSAADTGLFMTLTLIGDVFISLILALVADNLIGRRNVLKVGALLMAGSGVVFAVTNQWWLLLLASVVGVISPSGYEIGPFKALEEAILSQLASPTDRSTVFAWYYLGGAAGAALGSMLFGWIVYSLQTDYGWDPIASYRVVFWTYAALGIIKFGMTLLLSESCEVVKTKTSTDAAGSEETDPLLGSGNDNSSATDTQTADDPSSTSQAKQEKQTGLIRSALPPLSRHTALLIARLCLLFVLDSVGSGIASSSWLVYFFHEKFGLEEERLGSLFFATNLIAAASVLVAASLARRIGLVRTMVFTHLPSSLALMAIPLPNNAPLSVALLILRASIASMDSAPRQAFLAAVVLPEERVAVMGFVSVVKTLSQSAGPIITGMFAEMGIFGYAFVLAGGLKAVYDVLMLVMFVSHKPREETMPNRPSQTPEEEAQGTIDNERRSQVSA